MNYERKILIGARERIADGREHYVCMAAQVAAFLTNKDPSKACNAIEKQLAGATCLEVWLYKVHGINPRNFVDGPARMRRTRLTWIDHMLEHHPLFKQEGKA